MVTRSLQRLIWLFPLAFIIHDLEEVITMIPWMQQHADLVALMPIQPAVSTTAEVAVAVGYEWILTFVAAYFGARELKRGRLHWFFAGLTAALFLNVFTHLGQAVFVGGYIPGVVTVPIVLLPYMLLLGRRLFAEGFLDRRGLVRALVTGVPVGLAVVLTAHQIGRILI